MHVIMVSVGSWGDVEPYLALAQEILNRNQNSNNSNNKVDLFVQSQYEARVNMQMKTKRPTTCGGSPQNPACCITESSSNNHFRLHALPFSTQDFYKVHKPNATVDPTISINDPKLKHVQTVAEIMGELVLPCAQWILKSIHATIILHHDDDDDADERTKEVQQQDQQQQQQQQQLPLDPKKAILLSSALARPLCLLLSKVLQIPMVLVHLQPLAPNTIFPLYRVNKDDCVQAIMDWGNRQPDQQDGDGDDPSLSKYYEETYWKIDHPLEEILLKDRLIAAYDALFGLLLLSLLDSSSSSSPPTWSELQAILKGQDDRVYIANCFSNHLIPPIAGTRGVGPNVHEIGSSLADAYLPWNYTPDPELDAFLASSSSSKQSSRSSADNNNGNNGNNNNKAPICIGFGSMPFSELSAIMDALIQLDRPAILVGAPFQFRSCPPKYQDFLFPTGSSRSSKIFRIDFVPYSYLLPKCSMMLCHGGAGVVHATLRAGIPCLVRPIMGDQFLFASLLERKGLGIQVGGGGGGSSAGAAGAGAGAATLLAENIVRAVRKAEASSSPSDSPSCIRKNCRQMRQKILQNEETNSHGVVQLANLLETVVFGHANHTGTNQ